MFIKLPSLSLALILSSVLGSCSTITVKDDFFVSPQTDNVREVDVHDLSDSGKVGTLRWAINEANRTNVPTKIVFDGSLRPKGPSPTSFVLTQGELAITSKAPLEIVGIGSSTSVSNRNFPQLVIKSNNQSRIINISQNAHVKISNFIFELSKSDKGGAIRNDGTLELDKTIFKNNNAIQGGAIANYGSLKINFSQFSNNNAEYGGAIFNLGGIEINETTFKDNTANKRGGAIYTSNPINSLINLKNRIFDPKLWSSNKAGVKNTENIGYILDKDFEEVGTPNENEELDDQKFYDFIPEVVSDPKSS